eukprot:403365282
MHTLINQVTANPLIVNKGNVRKASSYMPIPRDSFEQESSSSSSEKQQKYSGTGQSKDNFPQLFSSDLENGVNESQGQNNDSNYQEDPALNQILQQKEGPVQEEEFDDEQQMEQLQNSNNGDNIDNLILENQDSNNELIKVNKTCYFGKDLNDDGDQDYVVDINNKKVKYAEENQHIDIENPNSQNQSSFQEVKIQLELVAQFQEPESALIRPKKNQKIIENSPSSMKRMMTPKRYVKTNFGKKSNLTPNMNNPSTSPLISSKAFAKKQMREKSPLLPGQGSGHLGKDEKEISLFKKKKIRTMKKDQNEDSNTRKGIKASKKVNKNKEKPFPEIQSQGSFESLKSGFGGVQGMLDIINVNKMKDSARSEMDKYQITRLQIAKQEKQNNQIGPLKSILKDQNQRKFNGKKKNVVFTDLPEFREEDEQAIINKNRKKYKKDRDPINIHRLKKKLHKFQIKPNDPILSTTYPKYYLSDQVEKKKFQTEIEVCKIHVSDLKIKGISDKNKLQLLQTKFLKKNPPPNVEEIYNSSLVALKKSIKFSDRKTILFELENTMLYPVYRKNQVMSYDASTYVKLIGQQTFKLYLSYRTYLLEMLSQLKEDFEIILFSSKNSYKYVEKVVEAIEKDNEKYFDHVISTEDMYYYKDIDFHILDLNVLLQPSNVNLSQNMVQDKIYSLNNNNNPTGKQDISLINSNANNQTNLNNTSTKQPVYRNIKDIIVVANTCGTYMFNLYNGIPLKEFYGNKQDISLFSLTRYLKTFRDVKDVRVKIREDFNLQISNNNKN